MKKPIACIMLSLLAVHLACGIQHRLDKKINWSDETNPNKVELSKALDYPLTKNITMHPELGTAQGKDQGPVYDRDKKEGLLEFALSIYNFDTKKGSSRVLYTCSKERYLFTKVDQSEITEDYNNDQAKIYLKKDGEVIEIGQYLPPEKMDPFNTWIHPKLCEAEYADTCHLEIRAKATNENTQNIDLQATFEIWLSNEPTQPSFVAKTSKNIVPNFTHFGCS